MASILADTNQKGGAIPAARFISALIAFKLIFDSENHCRSTVTPSRLGLSAPWSLLARTIS